MALVKRKIGNAVCFMPDGEYSLCGNAFDGEDGSEVFAPDAELWNIQQITCQDCRTRIRAVMVLIDVSKRGKIK